MASHRTSSERSDVAQPSAEKIDGEAAPSYPPHTQGPGSAKGRPPWGLRWRSSVWFITMGAFHGVAHIRPEMAGLTVRHNSGRIRCGDLVLPGTDQEATNVNNTLPSSPQASSSTSSSIPSSSLLSPSAFRTSAMAACPVSQAGSSSHMYVFNF